ncbi:MAG: ORF6N domain-containing protein [Verrucomicrobia bacterium]|jgi:hypothetical protein|nr:ORF6N domain-containing protein [Verrucomicrobiota bacterium]
MSEADLIPAARIERRIVLLRGQKVMLDAHLAELYGVQTKALNQAVKRNIERFPEDFMFQLSKVEAAAVMRSQLVTLNDETPGKPAKNSTSIRSQFVTASGRRNVRFRPYAFTEQGVAMLSTVLRSPQAIQVNINIMRTFVQLRCLLATHADLARRLRAMEQKYDAQFKVVFDAIRELMDKKKAPKAEIGFHTLLKKQTPRPTGRTPQAGRP